MTRIERVFSALSAKERAALVVSARNAGEDPDPIVYRTTPESQASEVRNRVSRVDHARLPLLTALMSVQGPARRLAVQRDLLVWFDMWAFDSQILAEFVHDFAQEVVGPIVSQEPAQDEMNRPTSNGRTRQRGTKGWSNSPSGSSKPQPIWGFRFAVVRNHDREPGAYYRARHDLAMQAIREAPHDPVSRARWMALLQPESDLATMLISYLDVCAVGYAADYAPEVRLCWQHLRAFEVVYAEVVAEWEIGDVLPQLLLDCLTGLKELLVDIHSRRPWCVEPFDLVEPTEAQISDMRNLVKPCEAKR